LRGYFLVAALFLAPIPEAGAQDLNPPDSGSTEQPGGGLPVPSGGDQPFQAQGDELLKKLTARQFDSRLPAEPLATWLSDLLGKRAQITWQTDECGDEGGGPDPGGGQTGTGQSGSGQSDDSGAAPGSNLDATLCTEAQGLFLGPDGKPSLDRYVVVQLWVGTRRNGVNLDAASYGQDSVSVFVFDGTGTRTLSRLGDLPQALATFN
jgi:hypothetical protein